MTRRAWARLAIAIVVGLAEPPLELAWRCRAGFEASEACVWGKSLLPLARIVAPVVIIPATLVILLLAEWLWTNAKARVRRER
jgi:hypothetical protein